MTPWAESTGQRRCQAGARRPERSAGLRTLPLVAIAACGFVQATETLLASHPEGTARIVEGIITGVGFVGGGARIKHGITVLGTVKADSLWATGAIGLSVGLGVYDVAIAISAITFGTLWFVVPYEEGNGGGEGKPPPM